jgi:tetratricopeptide (TPR) repeat protein
MARLDRLQSVKEIAQIASVIGRNFDYRTLAAIAQELAQGLDAALESLVEAELVFRRGTPPDAEYLFKHALVRDAAYESLLKSRRQAIHGRLLAVLEATGAQPEILAHHAEQAGETTKSIDYWERAGNNAVARPAYRESISHFENALRLLRQGAMDRSAKEQELRLLVSLGQAHIPASGYAAPATVDTFAHAVALADEIGDPPFRFAAMYGDLAGRYLLSVEDPARAERFVALTEQAGDQNARLAALRLLAVARFHLGRYSDAIACAEELLACYDPVQHRDHALRYGHDPRCSGLAYRSWSLWHLGFPDQAIETAQTALDWARQRNHGNTTVYSLVYCGMMANALMRRVPAILEIAQRALPITAEHGMPMWHNYARVLQGWALAQQGAAAEAVPEMSAGIAGLLATGTRRVVSFLYGLEAEAHALAGQTAESDAALVEAFRYLDETGDLSCVPLVQCIAGALRAGRDPAAAEVAFDAARTMARMHGSKGVELRAAIGLARLRRNEGRSREARAVLAPVYDWFTEGFGTPDLIEAKALLDELRA